MEPNTTVNVNINVTSNTQGADQATSSLSSFSTQLNQMSAIVGGIGLAGLFDNVGNAIENGISQVSQFQTSTTAVGTILDNVGNTATTMSDNMAAGASKVANALQEEQNATISYNEKVASLQEKIATVMQGDNVIDAQQSMYDQLNTLAEDHAEKVEALEQQIQDVQTNEANSLQDMKDGQDVKMQDLAEKHAQEMANATSDIQRLALEKKYNDEVQYDTDAFNRQYALKKSQDDRNTAQKIESINDQIAKEDDAYAEQYAKEQAADEKRISDLEATNAKELADYKQQLGDEERAYEEHMAKLQDTASGSSGSASNPMTMLPTDSQWLSQKQSLQSWMDQVNKMAQVSPYNYFDIVNYGRLVEAQGYNFLKLEPIIENIGAASGKSFGTTTQALMDGINGRIQMMSMELGLSKEKLEEFGAEYTKGIAGHLTDQESFFNAIQKISNGPDAGAANAQLHTLAGAYSNVQDAIFRTTASLLGFDATSGKTSGAFQGLSKLMLDFSNYLMSHQTQISNFFKQFDKNITTVLTDLETLVGYITSHNGVLTGLAALVGGVLAGAFYLWAAGIWAATVAFLASPLGWLVIAIGLVTAAVIFAILNWTTFKAIVITVADQIKTSAIDMANDVINFVNKVIDAINTLLGNKIFRAAISILLPGTNILPDQIGHVGTIAGGSTPATMLQTNGAAGLALSNAMANANGGVTINNNIANVNNNTDSNNLAKMMGLQVNLALH
jgi:hypothetical protein